MADPNQNPYADSDWLPEMFPKIQQMPGVRFFAATSNDEYVGLMMAFEVTPRGEFFLNGLRTDPAVRRSGCGTAILRQIDAQLAASGAKAVRMGVASWRRCALCRRRSWHSLRRASAGFVPRGDAAAAVPIRTATAATATASSRSRRRRGGEGDQRPHPVGSRPVLRRERTFFDGMIEKGCVYIAGGRAAHRRGGDPAAEPVGRRREGAQLRRGHRRRGDRSLLGTAPLRAEARRPGLGRIDPRANLWLPAVRHAGVPARRRGKVDGWARHSKTFEDVYGWEAGALAAAAK